MFEIGGLGLRTGGWCLWLAGGWVGVGRASFVHERLGLVG